MCVFVATVPTIRSDEQRSHVSDLRWANFFDLSRTRFLETHHFGLRKLRRRLRIASTEIWGKGETSSGFFSFVWCLKRNIRDLNQRMAVRIGSSDLVDQRISIKIASQVTDWQDHRCKSDKLFKENVCFKCGSQWRYKKEFGFGLRGQARFHKPGTKMVRDVELEMKELEIDKNILMSLTRVYTSVMGGHLVWEFWSLRLVIKIYSNYSAQVIHEERMDK